MKIVKQAQAGTFESSDILVLVDAADEHTGRKIELTSPVMHQYGTSIKQEINRVLDRYEVADIHLICQDKGALSVTICARVETALRRALDIQEGAL